MQPEAAMRDDDAGGNSRSRRSIKSDLPVLNKVVLNFIFENVYEECLGDVAKINKDEGCGGDEKIKDLMKTLQAMQRFNRIHRHSDIRSSFDPLDKIFKFYLGGSEGTDAWLAMIHAIRELYGLSETRLLYLMRQVDVRK